MESSFATHCSEFLRNALRPIAQYVTENEDASTMTVDELVEQFASQVGVSVPTSTSAPSSVPTGMFAPAMSVGIPSLNGTALPGLSSFTGLGGAGMVPPAGTGTAGKAKVSRAKGGKAKVAQPWLTLNDFLMAVKSGQQLCSYNPPRGTHKDAVCGAPATVFLETGNYTKYRCEVCEKNTGQLEKKIQSNSVVPAARTGTQVPEFTSPSASNGFGAPPIGGSYGLPSAMSMSMPMSSFGAPSGIPSFGAPSGIPSFGAPSGIPTGIPFPSFGGSSFGATMPAPQPQLSVYYRTGMRSDIVQGNNPDNRSLIFRKVSGPDGVSSVECIGRYNGSVEGDVESDYESRIVPLSSDDEAICRKYSVKYSPFKAATPSAISLPAIPTMQGIPRPIGVLHEHSSGIPPLGAGSFKDIPSFA